MVKTAFSVTRRLRKEGLEVTLVNMRFVKPLDRDCLKELAVTHDLFFTMEENVQTGGFGEQVLAFTNEARLPVQVEIAAIPDTFVGHGDVGWQQKLAGIDEDTVFERIMALWQKND